MESIFQQEIDFLTHYVWRRPSLSERTIMDVRRVIWANKDGASCRRNGRAVRRLRMPERTSYPGRRLVASCRASQRSPEPPVVS